MIFENVWRENDLADESPEALRISIDTKATLHVGEYSRGGKSRALEPFAAWDHDMRPKEKLAPIGILEVKSGISFMAFTGSHKTSDFIADGLWAWWIERQSALSHIKRLVINLDNGPECSGRRTRFLERAVQFADATGLELHFVYYPPYHSKYNAVERYWGVLERSWNGYLLTSVHVVLARAASFTWKGIKPIVRLLEGAYEKGVSLSGQAKADVEARLTRLTELPWWDITIHPKTVY